MSSTQFQPTKEDRAFARTVTGFRGIFRSRPPQAPVAPEHRADQESQAMVSPWRGFGAFMGVAATTPEPAVQPEHVPTEDIQRQASGMTGLAAMWSQSWLCSFLSGLAAVGSFLGSKLRLTGSSGQ